MWPPPHIFRPTGRHSPLRLLLSVCMLHFTRATACRVSHESIERSRGPPLRMRYPEIDFRLQLSADAARAFEVRRSSALGRSATGLHERARRLPLLAEATARSQGARKVTAALQQYSRCP